MFGVALVAFIGFACRGEPVNSEDPVSFRDGEAPEGLGDEVDQLRELGISLSESAEVGTVDGWGSVGPTGQAEYAIPIGVPPGAGDITPSLALAYNSGSGNSIFGLGWALSGYSTVARCPKTIADDGEFGPVELQPEDPVCLDGQRLVLISGSNLVSGAEYRTKRDPFSRITYVGGFKGGHFVVESRDGLISTYGETASHSADGVTYAWLLEEVRDRYDNAVDYEYSMVFDNAVLAGFRPTRIYWEGGKVEIVEDPAGRIDETRGFRYGQPLAQVDRIKALEVYGEGNVLLHTYKLGYQYEGLTNRSLLESVQKCDAAGQCLPATTFWYSPAGTTLTPPGEDLPGFPDGIRELLPEQLDSLAWTRKSIVGDFNGDLQHEAIIWNPEAGYHEVFRPDFGNFGTNVVGVAPPDVLPPSWEEYERKLDGEVREAAGFEKDPYEIEYKPDGWAVHRVQPTMTYAVINLDNDRRDDILSPAGGDRDAWGVGYADNFRVSTQGSDFESDDVPSLTFNQVEFDDGSEDPIYNIVPVDHDGNGLTDLWLCRGNGFKSSHWVLALNEGDTGEFKFSYHDSTIGCSIHDEINVLSLGRGGDSLVVIPAYEWDPASMVYPGSDPDAYLADVTPIDEGVRTQYLELRFDPGAHPELVATGLPRDLFQRWRDRECHNSVAKEQLGMPVFGAGLSLDKQVDLNGDGLMDIVRVELANDPPAWPGNADTEHNIDAITNKLGPGNSWQLGVTCGAYDPLVDHEDIVLRGWINTGLDFVKGDVLYTFDGNPHANLWTNIVGGQLLDRNRDGLADLIVPSTGLGGKWSFLISTGAVFDCASGQCFDDETIAMPPGWPTYRETEDWEQTVERASVIQPRAAQNVLFVGGVEDDDDPYAVDREVGALTFSTPFSSGSRLESVVDGLGAEESFDYTCAGQPNAITDSGIPTQANRPATTPRTCLTVVRSHSVQVRPESGPTTFPASTNYDYSGAVIDQHGRGLVGFEEMRSTLVTPSGYNTTTVEFDLSYDETLRDYPYAGTPARTRTTAAFDNDDFDQRLDVHCEDIDDWEIVIKSELGGDTWFAYASATHSYGTDVSSPFPLPDLPSCDDLNITEETFSTEERDTDGIVTLATTNTPGGEQITVTPSSFMTDATNWFIGKPRRVEVESCLNGTCATRTTRVQYNPPVHTVVKLTREPDAGATTEYLETDFDYEGHGRVRSVKLTDAFGEVREATTQWDAEGRLPLSTTNAEGHVSHIVTDEASGVSFASVAADGVTAKTEFDGFYRPVAMLRTASPVGTWDGARLRIEYLAGPAEEFGADNAAMRIQTTRFPNGQRVVVEYGPTGREIRRRWKAAPDADGFPMHVPFTSEWDGADVYVDTEYDDLGRPDRVSHPTLIGQDPEFFTDTEWDIFGRPVRRAVTDGSLVPNTERALERWGYDHSRAIDNTAGSVYVEHTDADGKTTYALYDLDGRVALTGDAANTLTCFGYGAFGTLETVHRNCSSGADGPSPTTVYGHDGIGRVTSETDPLFGTVTSTYTAFGEVDVTTDAAGVIVAYDYDLLGRPITRDDDIEGVATWEWDTERLGALFRTQSVDGFRRTYRYDDFGRISEERLRGPTAPDGTRMRWSSQIYSYGTDARLESIEFDAQARDPNFKIDLKYDEYGNFRSVHRASSGALLWGSALIDAAGQIISEEYGNGVITDRTYEPDLLRPDTIETKDPNGFPLQSLSYQWTPGGDLGHREDTVAGQLETFTHDDLHRLTNWDVGASTRSAQYDVLGNITSKSGAGSYTYDDTTGQLISTHYGVEDYAYAANGNLSSRGSTELTWTALDKIRSLSTPEDTLSYRYDIDGVRTYRTDGQEVRVQTSELFERRYDGALSEVRYRIPTSDGRTAVEVNYVPANCEGSDCIWFTYNEYVHSDHLGSSSLLTDVSGNASGGVNYDPWGSPRDRNDWTYYLDNASTDEVITGFTGHQPEVESGFINMRGRVYDPNASRFASPDPVVSDPLSSQGWSPYSYVVNRPLTLTDPTGLYPQGAEPPVEGSWGGPGSRGPGISWRRWGGGGSGANGVNFVGSGYHQGTTVYTQLRNMMRAISAGFNGISYGGGGLGGASTDPFMASASAVHARSNGSSGTRVAMAGNIPSGLFAHPISIDNSIADEGDAMERGDHQKAQRIRRGREMTVPLAIEAFVPKSTDDITIALAVAAVFKAAGGLVWPLVKWIRAKPVQKGCRTASAGCNAGPRAVKIGDKFKNTVARSAARPRPGADQSRALIKLQQRQGDGRTAIFNDVSLTERDALALIESILDNAATKRSGKFVLADEALVGRQGFAFFDEAGRGVVTTRAGEFVTFVDEALGLGGIFH